MDEEIDPASARRPHAAQIAELYPRTRTTGTSRSSTGAVGRRQVRARRQAGGTRGPHAGSRPTSGCRWTRRQGGQGRCRSSLGRGDGIGSNRGSSTATTPPTGKPLLANDPHLGVTMPGIWMQMGLHCSTVASECPLDVSGFSFSGVPGVVIGHNDAISWGFTNLDPDVTDLYLERVDGNNVALRQQVAADGDRTETIEVAGQDDGDDHRPRDPARPAHLRLSARTSASRRDGRRSGEATGGARASRCSGPR